MNKNLNNFMVFVT